MAADGGHVTMKGGAVTIPHWEKRWLSFADGQGAGDVSLQERQRCKSGESSTER